MSSSLKAAKLFALGLCVMLILSGRVRGAPEDLQWEFSIAAIFGGRHGSLLILNGSGWFEPSRSYAIGGGTTVLREASGSLVSGQWTLLSVLRTVPAPGDPRSVQRLDLLVLLPTLQPALLVLEVHVRRSSPGGGSAAFILGHSALDPGRGTFFFRATTDVRR